MSLSVPQDFAGRAALITGGGAGIGAATAAHLARRGASVVIADIVLDKAQRTAEEISTAGGAATAFQMDAGDHQQVSDAVDFTVESYGGLHHAINNCTMGPSGTRVGEMDLDDWHKTMNVSLNSVLYGLRYQIPAIANAGGGSIVNVSSIAGVWGTYNVASYVTAKHAIVGLTKAAALEHAADKVRINAIGPGYIDTELMRGNASPERREQLGKRHPVGRLGEPEEVGNLITFLLSDQASFITGSMHLVDGGFTAGYLGSNTANTNTAKDAS